MTDCSSISVPVTKGFHLRTPILNALTELSMAAVNESGLMDAQVPGLHRFSLLTSSDVIVLLKPLLLELVCCNTPHS